MQEGQETLLRKSGQGQTDLSRPRPAATPGPYSAKSSDRQLDNARTILEASRISVQTSWNRLEISILHRPSDRTELLVDCRQVFGQHPSPIKIMLACCFSTAFEQIRSRWDLGRVRDAGIDKNRSTDHVSLWCAWLIIKDPV
ncbi:hypothetical protein SDC9_201184 [bioreactor metagenome]|uniref:Uncharacterized protein n=1 Tax=bioreactor metagenome TaxID=1076179 RepID=A0A645IRF4_9ZZZZ